MKPINIVHEQWDTLIILDACRYDYFEQMYARYFVGDLSKRLSCGSCTDQWRNLSFPDYYEDIVYITANPQISKTSSVYGYLASEHFYEVHEVWKYGWNEELGTVFPQTLTDAAIDILKNTKHKRVIIHYLQPHAPYLVLDSLWQGRNMSDVNLRNKTIENKGYKECSAIKKGLLNYALRFFKKVNLLGNHPDWYLRKFFKIAPKTPMEAALRHCNTEGLRIAYRANLELVLAQVARLLQHLNGRIVISADHGDLLGENNNFSHPKDSFDPILREVPWLIIEKSKNQSPDITTKDTNSSTKESGDPEKIDDQAHQEELAQKLKSLGYYE